MVWRAGGGTCSLVAGRVRWRGAAVRVCGAAAAWSSACSGAAAMAAAAGGATVWRGDACAAWRLGVRRSSVLLRDPERPEEPLHDFKTSVAEIKNKYNSRYGIQGRILDCP